MMTKTSGSILIVLVCVASFLSVLSLGLSLSPARVVSYTVTQPYLSTITQSITQFATTTAYVTKTESRDVTQYITITTTSQYGAASYGSMISLTFLHTSWNNSLLLEAMAINPQGIGTSIVFHCEPYRVSDYIPFTYKAALSVPSGQSYWIIVRNLTLGSNVPIQVQDLQNPWLSTATVTTPFLMYISGSCQFRVP